MQWEQEKIKDIKCPKCKKKNKLTLLTEVWSGSSIQFEVEDNIREGSGTLQEGEPLWIYATCSCDHEWKLPGVYQITELDKE